MTHFHANPLGSWLSSPPTSVLLLVAQRTGKLERENIVSAPGMTILHAESLEVLAQLAARRAGSSSSSSTIRTQRRDFTTLLASVFQFYARLVPRNLFFHRCLLSLNRPPCGHRSCTESAPCTSCHYALPPAGPHRSLPPACLVLE